MPDVVKTSPDGTLSAADAQRIGAAAKACRIVAFPTETAYAIGSTGLVKAATRRLLQLKERSTLKPLSVLVASAEAAKTWVEWTPLADALAAKHWPGPLALLLKPTAQGRLLTFPEYPTIAVRAPSHPAARAIIESSGVPWVCTSANKSGRPPLTSAADVSAALGPEIDILVDGGSVPAGEPTVVDATGDKPRVVREGAAPVPRSILFVCTGNTCRSPMASLLAEKAAREDGLDWTFSSAGVASLPGAPISPGAARALAARGIVGARHSSRPLDGRSLAEADRVYALAREHRDALAAAFPGYASKVAVLREAAGLPDPDVEDPLGKPDDAYEECAARIEEALKVLIRRNAHAENAR